jgi:hypothetical protein
MDEPASDSIMLIPYCTNSTKLIVRDRESSGTFLSNSPGFKSVDVVSTGGWLSPLRFLQHDDYITIDLGESKIITRLDISPNHFFLFDLFPGDFEIQTSLDNKNWTSQFVEKDYSPSPSGSESWAFDEIETRYIKVLITRAKPFLLLFYLSYVGDISVYGCVDTEIASSESALSSDTDQTTTPEQKQACILSSTDHNFSGLITGSGSHRNDSVLTPLMNLREEPAKIQLQETPGIICDNGDLCSSSSGAWEMISEHDSYESSSLISEKKSTFTWSPDIPEAGSYAVYMWWSSGFANCSSCPVTISCNGELIDTVYVNQQQDGGQWNFLGTYSLESGNGCRVTIIAEGLDIPTCADALKLVQRENNLPGASIDFINPPSVFLDEEVCFSGRGIPGDQKIIEVYSWISQLEGEIGTTDSFCTSSLSEGIHHISFKVQDDHGSWSVPIQKTIAIVNTFTPLQEVWLEAEEATVSPPMETDWNNSASNGEYIWVPNGQGNSVDPTEDGGSAEYSFEVLEEGNFLVWGRVSSNSTGDNSFWMSIDNSNYLLWDTPSGDEETWVWDRVSNRGESGPVVFHLEAGSHTMVIRNREDGNKLDKILITNDIAYHPTGKRN